MKQAMSSRAMWEKNFLMIMFAAVVGVTGASYAAPITVTSWWLSSTVYDGVEWRDTTDTLVRFPLNETLIAEAGPLHATSTYSFQTADSSVVFRSDFLQQRGGTPPTGWRYTEGASSSVTIMFTANEDVHYEISGLFTATGPGTDMKLRVYLGDVSQNILLDSYQLGAVDPGQGYQVGGLAGSSINLLVGSLSGMLEAGRSYQFSADYDIYASVPDVGATASGWLLLEITPEPATGIGFVVLIGAAIARYRRSG